MEQRKRTLIFVTFFMCTASLALLTASLATHKWIISRPIRSNALNTTSFLFRDEFRDNDDLHLDVFSDFDTDLPRKFRGRIYFGLFQGTKVLNYGLGDRTAVIWLKQEMIRNPTLMSFTAWFLTILAVSIGMIFALVSAIFAIINTVMTPIESITGVQGLFLWNGLSTLFSTGAALLWSIQFWRHLSKNVMTEEEQRDGWNSEGRSALGSSFYFVLSAAILHIINIILVLLALRRRKCRRATIDKHPEGIIMLY